MVLIARYTPRADRKSEYHFESTLAHKLLQHALQYENYTGRLIKEASGRPIIAGRPDLYVSLSHCTGLVACAIANRPVGIDAEQIRPFNPIVAKRVCSPKELNQLESCPDRDRIFFQLWTLKESYGKALGVGISYPLCETSFSPAQGMASSIPDYKFSLREDLEGYVIALCLRV